MAIDEKSEIIYVDINTLPEFAPISNFENCEADISGVADFYFYLKDTEILNGQPGYINLLDLISKIKK